jgi:Ty3 transposon capsid-like protein
MDPPSPRRTRSQTAAGRAPLPTNPVNPPAGPTPPSTGTTAPSWSGAAGPASGVPVSGTSGGVNPTGSVGVSFNVRGMTTVINDLKLTEKFVGESFHDFLTVDAFLEAVADFFTLKHITADVEKLVYVSRCFPCDSPAGIWFTTNRRASNFRTYTDFETLFRARFALTTADKDRLLQSVQSFTQRGQDSVTQFHAKFVKLTSQLASINRSLPDFEIVALFVKGLRADIRLPFATSAARNPVTTLDEARELACSLERALRIHGYQPPPPPHRLNGMQVPDDGENVPEHCWYCRKPGHNAADCWKIKRKIASGMWKGDPPGATPRAYPGESQQIDPDSSSPTAE